MRIRSKSTLLLAAALLAWQMPLAATAQNLGSPASPDQAGSPVALNQALSAVPLQAVPGHGNAQGWLSPAFRRRRSSLRTLYVAPIQVQLAADSPYRELTPDEVAKLNQQFQLALAAQLPADLHLVAVPQADTLRVEITLARSEVEKQGFRLRNLTPIGFLISHAKTAVGVSKISFRQMVVAVRAYDAEGAPLLALDMKPQGIPADPGSALNPADADPNQVPMTPVRLDQLPGYLAAKTPQFLQALRALQS